MPIPSAARFSIFKVSTLPPGAGIRRCTSIFFCIFVVKLDHGSLCCSRALSRVIKVSCRFIIFIYKETKHYLFLQGARQHYGIVNCGLLSACAPTRECRKSVSGARKLRLHAANLQQFSLYPAGGGGLRTPPDPQFHWASTLYALRG